MFKVVIDTVGLIAAMFAVATCCPCSLFLFLSSDLFLPFVILNDHFMIPFSFLSISVILIFSLLVVALEYTGQADLVFCALLYCDLRILCFYRLQVCGNPTSSKSVGAVLPMVFVHFMSLCHMVILALFRTFLSFYIVVLCDQ